LDDVQHPGHLTEDQNFVLPLEQSVQHLVQDLDLSTDLNKVFVNAIVNTILSEWVLDQIGMVGHFPHVHHPVLQTEVEGVRHRVGIHFAIVGGNHSGVIGFLVFLHLTDLERKMLQ